VDAVLRRPRPVLVPFLVDVAYLLVGTGLFVGLAGVELLFPQGYRLPNFPVAVAHALPTVGDVMGPTPALHELDRAIVLAASLLILLSIPLLAYAEAGFLGVLRAVYLQPEDPLETGRAPDAWAAIRAAFADTANRHFRTFLVLRGIQAALAFAALLLPLALPRIGNYGLAVLAVDILLLYAPYAAVETGRGPFAAARESIQLVSDHLATTLVALLFGFLLTGGVAILLTPLVAALGPWSPFLASALDAPVGTALALFLYRVYLGFYPREALPESTPAPAAAATGI
jgi:hypothetical protein